MSGFGYRINGRSAERVAVKQALADPADFVWVHLNTTEERAQIWLRDAAGLDDYVVDALTAMETRPRCEAFEQGALLNLRGRSTDEQTSGDALASVRIWAIKGHVYSVSRRPLYAVDAVEKEVESGHVADPGDLISAFATAITAVLPSPADYGAMVARATQGWDVELMFEPGRVIAGNSGVLLTEVVWVKPGVTNPYVIVDAAMNDLARPALYDAWHDFDAVTPTGERMTANIAGPVCESGDTFAMGREIDAVKSGDLAVFRTAGAYGATMASTYNSRDLVPEVLVDGDRYAVVADRIAAETILAAERVPEWLKA